MKKICRNSLVNSLVNFCVTTLALTCVTVGATAWAVEQSQAAGVTVAELKSRMKSLTNEALKAGDLWTAIQADAYSNIKLGVRTNGVLGKSAIIGNPLFAFPHLINAYWDRGDRIIVVSGSRVYLLSPDGYPLGVSIPLKITPTYSSLNEDGRYLAMIQRINWPKYIFKIVVIDMTDNSEAWSAELELTRGEYLSGPVRVSQEGHAVAFAIERAETAPFLQVVRSNGNNSKIPGYYRANMVGAEAKWGIAEPNSNRTDETNLLSVLIPGQVVTVNKTANSRGIAAILTDEPAPKLKIVSQEGEIRELPQPMRFSKTGLLLSTGDWLVAASGKIAVPETPTSPAPEAAPDLLGQAAKPPAEKFDLLGQPIEPEAPTVNMSQAQPYTLACYSWADLVNSPTAAPKHMIAGTVVSSNTTPGLIYVLNDGKAQAINLNDNPLQPRAIGTLGKVIDIDMERGQLILSYTGDKRQIFNEDGAELWSGVARKLRMLDARHAVVHSAEGKTDLVHLASDVAQRKELNLDIPDKTYYSFEYDRYDRRVVASADSRTWIEYDPLTGKRIAAHVKERRKPEIPSWGTPYGRFSVQAARLVERNAPPPADPSFQWNPRDAWRINNTLLVLDHHGQVYVSGKKRGTYTTIGSVDWADRFGFSNSELGIINVVDTAAAFFAAGASGPVLSPAKYGNDIKMEEMPEGPWRIKRNFYIPPRSAPYIFDPSTCGFSPRVLRSPIGGSTQNMLLVTDSLIIDVDVKLGMALGVNDKNALRDKDE